MAVSYDADFKAVPILHSREQNVNDDFVIWEEDMQRGLKEKNQNVNKLIIKNGSELDCYFKVTWQV